MENIQFYTKRTKFSLKLYHLRRTKRYVYALFTIFLLLFLANNSATLFCAHFAFIPTSKLEGHNILQGNVHGKSRNGFSLPSSANLVASVMYAVKVDNLVAKPDTQLAISRKNRSFLVFTNTSAEYNSKRGEKVEPLVNIKSSKVVVNQFSAKMRGFFQLNFCKKRFFMTWISSLEDFSQREIFAIESLFKSHPNGCLVIVSDAMDSVEGMVFFRPFLDKGFKVMAISPDYSYLFKNTPAEAFVENLMNGKISRGEISFGQNLSNLVRLGLLYRFGGIYLDTDVIVLKRFAKLRNAIGAQSVDSDTKNWTRLNNAVMIFDKGHPLVYKFIQEFALTFDGNKWGHNGPYLVSRVVARVQERPAYKFTVLPPPAFYPVDWSRIGNLFSVAGGDEARSKWLLAKLEQIQTRSFAIHLWNKQSRKLEAEEGSIIRHIMSDYCILCNSSVAG